MLLRPLLSAGLRGEVLHGSKIDARMDEWVHAHGGTDGQRSKSIDPQERGRDKDAHRPAMVCRARKGLRDFAQCFSKFISQMQRICNPTCKTNERQLNSGSSL